MAIVRYLVSDLDASIEFYCHFFSCRIKERWGSAFAELSRHDLRLWLAGPETSAARPMPDGRVPHPGGWNRIVMEVSDIAVMAAKLREAGVVFRSDIIEGPGGKQVLIEDPSGNPIEVFESR